MRATRDELERLEGKKIDIAGGADLFVSAKMLVNEELPTRVAGKFISESVGHQPGEEWALYFVGREFSGGEAITSPIFTRYE